MDSGNSGSIQSSSGGGDDEYDPRNESISSFLNSSSTGNSDAGFLTNTQSQLPLPSSSSTPFFFDQPFSNYFSQPTSTPQQNIWAKDLRSDPNSTDVRGVFMPSSTQPAHYIQTPSSSISLPPTSPSSSDQPNLTRSSKKRTRASRRAPTTVLTTDTSNFRAMVQEFTGIPAPPFSSSASPYQRTRHDLYNNASSHLDPIRPPPYLLRPFAQKPLSSSPSNMYLPRSSNQISTKNFQLLSELGLSKQPVNMQNNSIQSLLQQSTVPHQNFFTPNLSNTRMTPIPLDHLPSFPTSDGMTIRENSITNSSHANEDGNQEHLRYSNHQVGKSCSDKETDQNVSSRGVGEGTVDSWINSSD